jgi:alpha-L-fucosidase
MRSYLVPLLLLLGTVTYAQDYRPAPENLKAREWFQDSKFGLFIHWGVYSVRGEGEWVMNEKGIPISEYEKLAPQFNPTEFDAAAIVAMAKNAGMRYITFTSKHHDGFAMWPTKQGPWNIVEATPYKKDIIKMLADECQKQGIKLFLYHSHLDWHHPDYFPRGRTGLTAGRPEQGDFNRYLDYMDAQLTELLTNYGPIAGIWFDGIWDKPTADWRLTQTYELIHRLQPAALISNNHHLKTKPGEDFQAFEKDLPGANTAGFSGESEIGRLPLETCETMNGAWGYNKNDKRFKSTKDLIHYLVRAAGHNSNFLLNVGPMPNGKVQPEFTARLAEIGQWLRTNGTAVYATRGGPLAPRTWGVSTENKTQVFVHILDWHDELLPMPSAGLGTNPRFLKSGEPVKTTVIESSVILHLPEAARDPIDTVIVWDK